MRKKIKLAPYTLKRYEPKLGVYFFCNVKSADLWKTDSATGAVVASLDGSLTVDEIIDIIAANSPQIPKIQIKEHFNSTFDFLLKEGFLCEVD